LRKEPEQRGRSINLALSVRGIATLKQVEVFDRIASQLLPMKARMLHLANGKSESVPYGTFGEVHASLCHLVKCLFR
jgi:kynurenine 3-monooxygenase